MASQATSTTKRAILEYRVWVYTGAVRMVLKRGDVGEDLLVCTGGWESGLKARVEVPDVDGILRLLSHPSHCLLSTYTRLV